MRIEIILMVVFRGIKICKSRDFRYNGLVISFAFIQFGFIMQRFLPLLFIVIEDGAPILWPDIIALSIQRGWVMAFPKHFQQFIE